MKRYIKPDIETIKIPSVQLLTSSEEDSQVHDAMSKRHDGDFNSNMNEATSNWLQSDSFWDDGQN